MAGKTPPSLVGEGEQREKLNDFTSQTYGVRIGGPIIQDKLFFFLNYERQEDEFPAPFNFSNYAGRSSLADLETLENFLINNYGYDPLIFDDNGNTLESNRRKRALALPLDSSEFLSGTTARRPVVTAPSARGQTGADDPRILSSNERANLLWRPLHLPDEVRGRPVLSPTSAQCQ